MESRSKDYPGGGQEQIQIIIYLKKDKTCNIVAIFMKMDSPSMTYPRTK
jgi:hypothetical protein